MTHLNRDDDEEILKTLGDAGPDLIIGGHDHEHMAIQVGEPLDPQGRRRRPHGGHRPRSSGKRGKPRIEHEIRPLSGDAPRPDPEVQALVDQWQAKHEQAFCQQAKADPNCLEEVYGRTRTELEAEETKIRGSETSLGDWVTDRMVAAFAACGAQAALINSGTLRLNQDLAAGTPDHPPPCRRAVRLSHALYLLRLDGATLQKVADQSVRGWPGSGAGSRSPAGPTSTTSPPEPRATSPSWHPAARGLSARTRRSWWSPTTT